MVIDQIKIVGIAFLESEDDAPVRPYGHAPKALEITLLGLVASGCSSAEILGLYPYLEDEDIREALTYAAWRVEEVELPLVDA